MIRIRTLCIAFLCLALMACVSASENQHAKSVTEDNVRRPLLPADVVQMVEFADKSSPVSISPDGKAFVVVTQNGNIAEETNDYEITLYQMSDVIRQFESSSSYKKLGRVIARLSSASNYPAVRQLRWLPGSQVLAFVGITTTNPIAQVYTLDVEQELLRQRTFHPKPVLSFDINARGDLIFTAAIPIKDNLRNVSHYIVDQLSMDRKMVMKVQDPDDIYAQVEHGPIRQTWSLPAGQKVALKLGDAYRGIGAQPLRLSPDGRWALTVQDVLGIPPKSWLQEYPSLAQTEWLQHHNAKQPDHVPAENQHVSGLNQIMLIDIHNAKISPLLNAPMALYYEVSDLRVVWQGDEVKVSQTYLPLELGRDAQLLEPTRVSYNLKTRKIKVATDTDNQLSESAGTDRLKFYIQQDLNTPPDLFVDDVQKGRALRLTDLNPEFESLEFGRVETFTWRDNKRDKSITAGLVFPTNYQKGQRYPLVIQTHGFNPEEFLIEGPHTAYAAQAFANRGIMVVQLPDLANNPERREAMRSAVESLIDKMDAIGLIDRNRVGMIGFSATGHAVQHFITFSDYPIAAASIADAFSISVLGYAAWFPHGMSLFEQTTNGIKPWGQTRDQWVAQDPSLNLDKVTTALLLEEYSAMYAWWDVYTLLRRMGKAVEWIDYPNGDHGLVKPVQRLVSQTIKVDWFCYWLKGEIDPAPEKAEQYQRWKRFQVPTPEPVLESQDRSQSSRLK